MTSNPTNLISINIARGLAAFSVFVYHYGVGTIAAKYSGITQFNWIAIPGAIYGVTLFFVISGFCIHGSEWRRLQHRGDQRFDGRAYFRRRVLRIYPVYIFSLAISCALILANGVKLCAGDIFYHVLLLHGFSQAYFNSINLVLWTISIEAFFYVIYPLWLDYRVKVGLHQSFIVGAGICLSSLIVSAIFFYPYG